MANITQISTSTDLSALSGTKVSASASSSSSSSSSTDTAKSKSDALKNQFLKILLTQMSHQNPLDPMDTKEFTGQLTQFSALEQQIDTNTKLDSLLGSIQQNTLTSAFGYIGQYVNLKNSTSTLQNGGANWTYALPQEAASVTISVTDSKGNLLYKEAAKNTSGGSEMAAGTYNFAITNADLAKAQADGAVLKFSIAATDKNGKSLTPSVSTTVKVESVQSDKDGTYLQAGGILFAISDVKKIVQAPSSATNTTNGGSTTQTAA